jgi:hypothetical protein
MKLYFIQKNLVFKELIVSCHVRNFRMSHIFQITKTYSGIQKHTTTDINLYYKACFSKFKLFRKYFINSKCGTAKLLL